MTATATVFCHRVYTRRAFTDGDRFVVAAACVFVACKCEDAFRRLKDTIIAAHAARWIMDHDATTTTPPPPHLSKESPTFEKWRAALLSAEFAVLAQLGFDLTIDHPFLPLTTITARLNLTKDPLFHQRALTLVNDSYFTALCLTHTPTAIACGAIYVSARICRVPLPSPTWSEAYSVHVSSPFLSLSLLSIFLPFARATN